MTTRKLLNKITAMCEFDYDAGFHSLTRWQEIMKRKKSSYSSIDGVSRFFTMIDETGKSKTGTKTFCVKITEII